MTKLNNDMKTKSIKEAAIDYAVRMNESLPSEFVIEPQTNNVIMVGFEAGANYVLSNIEPILEYDSFYALEIMINELKGESV